MFPSGGRRRCRADGWPPASTWGAGPASRSVGYDLSEEGIAATRSAAGRRGLTTVRLEARDVARPAVRRAFDAVHDQSDPAGVPRNVAAALRPGGTFLMQDIRTSGHVGGSADQPLLPFIYTISCLHCMLVSLAGGGPGLGAAWGQELALRLLADAGLRDASVSALPYDLLNYYYVAPAPAAERTSSAAGAGFAAPAHCSAWFGVCDYFTGGDATPPRASASSPARCRSTS